MKDLQQATGELVWEPLLTPEEIVEWWKTRRRPRKLWRIRGMSTSLVYRFVFDECDGSGGRHTPCYIGEVGDYGRLSQHFSEEEQGRGSPPKQAGDPATAAGWWIRGAVQMSRGNFRLETLKIKGSIRFMGVILNQDDLQDPHARRLLENWAILHARNMENLYPYNCGISQGTKDFRRMAKATSRKRKRGRGKIGDLDANAQ
jgi:hypothetical protein